uniref:DDE superfamily endonuclease domain-containing protein n=1 Tax=Trepomonas sp. PC1 TaxID=1076344 RepID=A0A146KLV5_9EUKA|eukprot:JAP96139.1 DDE superfamily endonuclease domain-containing protein [Trepomonas sp. PC1]
MTFMKEVLNYFRDQGHMIFFMDNCSIHKNRDLLTYLNEHGHRVHFNWPYTPELQPIENFFAAWKSKVDVSAEVVNSSVTEQLLNVLIQAFDSISFEEIRNMLAHVENVIVPLIYDLGNL